MADSRGGPNLYPNSALIAKDGVLLGETSSVVSGNGGGVISYGTVYDILPSGKESIIYNFPGPTPSGELSEPLGGLAISGPALYGTDGQNGVFSLSP